MSEPKSPAQLQAEGLLRPLDSRSARGEAPMQVPYEATQARGRPMNEPKRAEPNEHVQKLRDLAQWQRLTDATSAGLISAAAEIERLAERVVYLEQHWMPVKMHLTVDSERPWLPIAGAPRDGTRVELWFPADIIPAHADYGHCEAGWWADDALVIFRLAPTHYRREPSGPESKPDQETKGER